jgi:hypothetical protein
MYHSRLITAARLKHLAEAGDAIANYCVELTDALCDYENATELPAAERADARDEAREAAMTAISEMLTEAGKLRAEYDQLEASMA